jgi:hypothetical protein
VEDYAERETLTRSQLTDAMSHFHAVIAAGSEFRSFIDREYDAVSLSQFDDLNPRLHTRALFCQHELSAFEVILIAKQYHDLQWEHILTIQILMQAIEIACTVFEH